LRLFYNEVLFDTYEDEEVAFIGQRSGGGIAMAASLISKIKYTALLQNLP
jgi:cephalosporin-C deacetylase-like acetyl esterase